MKQIDVKFKKEARNVDRKLARGQFAMILLLALTSTFILYNLSNNFFSNYIQNDIIRFILCCVVVYVMIEAIDMGLKTFLPYVAIELLSTDFKKATRQRKTFVYSLAGVCFIQLIATSYLTLSSADDITSMTMDKPSFDKIETVSSNRTGQFELSLEGLNESIEEAKNSEKKRVIQAKAKGHSIVNDAIYSKGKRMAELYLSGNNWAYQKLAFSLDRAKKDSSNLVSEELALVPTLLKQKTKFINSQSANDKAIFQPLAEWQKSEIHTYQTKKATRNSLIKYAAIVFALGFLILTFIRANYRVSTIENPHPTDEEKSLWEITSASLKRAYQSNLERLEKMVATPVKFSVATAKAPMPQEVDLEVISSPRRGAAATPKSSPRVKSGKYDNSIYDTMPEITLEGGTWQLKMLRPDGVADFISKSKLSDKIRNCRRRVKEIEPLVRIDPEKQNTLTLRRKKLAFYEKARTMITTAEHTHH